MSYKPPANVQRAAKTALAGVDAAKVPIQALTAGKMLSSGESLPPTVIRVVNGWWQQNKKNLMEAEGTDARLEAELFGGADGAAWFSTCYRKALADVDRVKTEDKKNEIRYKDELLDIKDVDESKGIVTGYFAHFDNKDSVGDVIKKGAFLETINDWGPQGKNRIKLLFNHNPSDLIGIPKTLREDDEGLYHESQVTKNSRGLDILKLIADGAITEHSIGYTTLGYEFDDEDYSIMYLTKIKLYEGSFVTWGANEMTPVTGMKSLLPVTMLKTETDPRKLAKGIQEILERADKSLRTGDWKSEDVPAMLDLTLKTLRPIVNSFIEGLDAEVTSEVTPLKRVVEEVKEAKDNPVPDVEPGREEADKEAKELEQIAKLKAELTKEYDFSELLQPSRAEREREEKALLEKLGSSFDFDFSSL